MLRRIGILALALAALPSTVFGQGAIAVSPQVTRQSTTARTARTPGPGELVLDTTTGELYQGDGARKGGVIVNNGQTLNLKSLYGAKGDTATLQTVTGLSAGSTTLPVSGYTANSADVGKTIEVPGAGAAGATLVTTIAAVATNQLTLTAAAQTSITSATVTYGTDDTNAIRNAVAAAPSGATLFAPAGTYLVSGRIDLSSKQGLLLAPSAVLKASANMTAQRSVVYVGNGVTDVHIEGGTIDGNRQNNPAGQIHGIQIYSGCARVSVRNVHIKDVPADAGGGNYGDGIYVGTAAGSGLVPSDVLIDGCSVENAYRNAVSITAVQGARVCNNSLTGCVGNTPGFGIDIEPNSALDPCTDIVVASNTLSNNFGGVHVGGAGTVSRVTVIGNTMTGRSDNEPASSSNAHTGVNVGFDVSDVVVADNVISTFTYGYATLSPRTIFKGNAVRSCRHGVQVSADHSLIETNVFTSIWGENPIKIQGNYLQLRNNIFTNCMDPGRLSSLSISAVGVINCVDTYLYPSITGNTIYDDRTSNNAPVGIRLTNVFRNQFTYTQSNNRISGVVAPYTNNITGGANTVGSNTPTGVTNSDGQPNLGTAGTYFVGSAVGNILTSANACSFEADVSTVDGLTGCTAAQSSDYSLEGTKCLKLTATTTGNQAAFCNFGNSALTVAVPGVTYTGIAYFRAGTATSGSVALQLYGVNASGSQVQIASFNSGTPIGDSATGWQRLTVTGVIDAALQGRAFLRFRYSPANVGETIYVDCAGIFPGYPKLWNNSGSTLTEVGPTGWLVGGTTTADQPIFFGAKGNAPINLNLLGGTGGTRFGDGKGNSVAYVTAAGKGAFTEIDLGGASLKRADYESKVANPYKSGRYYFVSPASTTNTLNNLGTGNLRLSPIWLPAVTLASIGAEITSVGDTGSKVRLAIYADDGSGAPGSLVLDAGTIAGDSVGQQEITISQALPAGLYWIGGVIQSVSSSQPTVRTVMQASFPIPLPSTPGAGQTVACIFQSGVTGACPGTFTGTAISNNGIRTFIKIN